MVDHICEILESIIPDVRWDDESVWALEQAVALLKKYRETYGELSCEPPERSDADDQ